MIKLKKEQCEKIKELRKSQDQNEKQIKENLQEQKLKNINQQKANQDLIT